MRIGLVYDLRDDVVNEGGTPEEAAEFDTRETIDGLVSALEGLGYEVDRVGNIKALAAALVGGARWDLLFNIAEGRKGFGREAQVPALAEAYEVPYTFSDPLVMTTTLHKGVTKALVARMGVPTAPFAVVESVQDLARLDLQYPLFAKPVAEGTSKGITGRSRIKSPEMLHDVVLDLLEEYAQPVIIEEYLPGREFTVGIVGTGKGARVIGALEIVVDP